MQVKQPGHVTRIVSGCTPEEEVAMKTWFRDHIQYMSKRFHIHLTPKFSEVKDETGKVVGDYKFFNKPYGLKHFLENFEMIGFNEGSFAHPDDIVFLVSTVECDNIIGASIVALSCQITMALNSCISDQKIDPDMPLTRKLKSDFSDERETIIAPRRQGKNILATKVQRGIPFAQTYGLGTQWQKFDLDKIAGADSPAKQVNSQDGQLFFPVGPPYIFTIFDGYVQKICYFKSLHSAILMTLRR